MKAAQDRVFSNRFNMKRLNVRDGLLADMLGCINDPPQASRVYDTTKRRPLPR
jgi:hypothetical protein